MSLVQLIVPTEVAHDTIAELGELGNVQFKDVSHGMENTSNALLNVLCNHTPIVKP